MNQDLFSIIIPVYNAEKYLNTCISSILAQTYTHYELILVDDGSTDQSSEICNRYAAQDKRINVIHQKNGGVSRARNKGIDAAKGEWICFVDSDDEVKPNWLEYYANNADADLLIQSIIKVYPAGNTEEISVQNKYLENDERFKIDSSNNFLNSPCKCFKTDIIRYNHLRFLEDMHQAEDLLFVLEYMHVSKTVHLLSYAGYIYNHQNNTLVKRIYPADIKLRWSKNIFEVTLKLCRGNTSVILYKSLAEFLFNSLSQYVTYHYIKIEYNNRKAIYDFLRKLLPYIRWYYLKWTRYVFLFLFLPNRIFDGIIRCCSKMYWWHERSIRISYSNKK